MWCRTQSSTPFAVLPTRGLLQKQSNTLSCNRLSQYTQTISYSGPSSVSTDVYGILGCQGLKNYVRTLHSPHLNHHVFHSRLPYTPRSTLCWHPGVRRRRESRTSGTRYVRRARTNHLADTGALGFSNVSQSTHICGTFHLTLLCSCTHLLYAQLPHGALPANLDDMPSSHRREALVDVMAPGYLESNATVCEFKYDVSTYLKGRPLVAVYSTYVLHGIFIRSFMICSQVDRDATASALGENNLVETGKCSSRYPPLAISLPVAAQLTTSSSRSCWTSQPLRRSRPTPPNSRGHGRNSPFTWGAH